MDNDRIFFSYDKEGIKCGLAKIKDNIIYIIKKEINIFSGYIFYSSLARDSFSCIKKTNDTIILSLVDDTIVKFVSISINQDEISKSSIIEENFNYDSIPYFIKLVKNNYDELIILLSYLENDEDIDYKSYIQELDYTSCISKSISVYNAKKTKLDFNYNFIYATMIDSEDKGNIVIFNNGIKINSLIDNKGNTIDEKKIYNQDNVYFNLSSEDYIYYINTNAEYQFNFSNSLKERNSQICTYTISFYPCKKYAHFAQNIIVGMKIGLIYMKIMKKIQ